MYINKELFHFIEKVGIYQTKVLFIYLLNLKYIFLNLSSMTLEVLEIQFDTITYYFIFIN